MRASLSVFISSIALAAALAGCGASAVPKPTEADSAWAMSRWPDTSQTTLSTGRDLYIRKCGGCHTLYTPAEVLGGDWPDNLNEMADRAKLPDSDRGLIARYLETIGRHAL